RQDEHVPFAALDVLNDAPERLAHRAVHFALERVAVGISNAAIEEVFLRTGGREAVGLGEFGPRSLFQHDAANANLARLIRGVQGDLAGLRAGHIDWFAGDQSDFLRIVAIDVPGRAALLEYADAEIDIGVEHLANGGPLRFAILGEHLVAGPFEVVERGNAFGRDLAEFRVLAHRDFLTGEHGQHGMAGNGTVHERDRSRIRAELADGFREFVASAEIGVGRVLIAGIEVEDDDADRARILPRFHLIFNVLHHFAGDGIGDGDEQPFLG